MSKTMREYKTGVRCNNSFNDNQKWFNDLFQISKINNLNQIDRHNKEQ